MLRTAGTTVCPACGSSVGAEVTPRRATAAETTIADRLDRRAFVVLGLASLLLLAATVGLGAERSLWWVAPLVVVVVGGLLRNGVEVRRHGTELGMQTRWWRRQSTEVTARRRRGGAFDPEHPTPMATARPLQRPDLLNMATLRNDTLARWEESLLTAAVVAVLLVGVSGFPTDAVGTARFWAELAAATGSAVALVAQTRLLVKAVDPWTFGKPASTS